MNEREQPTMDCPKCGATYDDFDGVGVVYCEACGFCQHLARRGERPDTEGAPRVWICEYCGDRQPEVSR